MSDAVARPLPRPDALTQGFWDAVAVGKLAIQRCPDCGNYQHPPRPICHACGCAKPEYQDVSGAARLVSWTVTHHNVVPAIAAALPYTCLVVELAEQPGLYMMSDLIGREALRQTLRVGMRMRTIFPQPVGDNPKLPQFEPVRDATP